MLLLIVRVAQTTRALLISFRNASKLMSLHGVECNRLCVPKEVGCFARGSHRTAQQQHERDHTIEMFFDQQDRKIHFQGISKRL